MNPELNLFNQRKFSDISAHLQTGPCVWKLENGKFKHFWSKNKFSKTKAPVIYLHLKNVVCFYINSLKEWKNAFVCSYVPWSKPNFGPTREKFFKFHLGCCVCILPILLPGKKMLVSSPTRKSIVVNIIKMTAIYLLKPFNFKVFIDFWPWCVWGLHVTLAKVNKLAYFMTD